MVTSAKNKRLGRRFQAVRGFSVFVLLILTFPVSAACPPYTPDFSLLERIAELPHLSPEEKEKLKTAVQKKPPDKLGELAMLEGFMRFFGAATLPHPLSGPAPFTMGVEWGYSPVPNLVKIEVDADGDGTPEWVESRYEALAGREHIYYQEGQYQFTVRIYDKSGKVTTHKTPIRVLSLAAFDAELQERWSGLKEALRRGDIAGGLECIHTQSRDRYKEVFAALSSTLPQEVDQILTTVQFLRHRRGEAIYESLRTDAGITKSFEVRFATDVDGVWRITSF